MEKLITGIHLPAEICSLIDQAENKIQLVCPFIELHHHFKRSLKRHVNNKNIHIAILYGKYSNNEHYKLNETDLDFLKTFPNIEVRYNFRLHAKYYGNEKNGLITSLNLNNSSHHNNLEFGIRIDLKKSTISNDVVTYINEIFEESEVIHCCVPKEQPEKKNYFLHIEKIKERHANAYERWSLKDDNMLEQLFCEGKSIEELSETFKRQPSAINARINKLELLEKYGVDFSKSLNKD
jgi:phosphatidylserine/phosphatidylglycerophosphate/cardiolipin synthase-like enzyme